jgi:hypothetical protein
MHAHFYEFNDVVLSRSQLNLNSMNFCIPFGEVRDKPAML